MSRAVLLDFDGVIADSIELSFAVTAKLYPGLTRDDLNKLFEGNAVKNILGFANITMEQQKKHFDTHFHPAIEGVGMFAGMAELIPVLAAKYPLFIISSGDTRTITAYLMKRGLGACFQSVLGSDVRVSKHEKIKLIFEEYGLVPGECVFVSDTLGDIREAAVAGVDTIAVLWGLHGKELLQKGDPWAMAATPKELALLIDKKLVG